MQRLKVEILIPKFDNNKKRIDSRKHRYTYQEIVKQFRGCTRSNIPLIGDWIDEKSGKKYRDKNFSYWVLCQDNIATVHFLNELKKRLKERYEQEEIMMYSTEIFMI